MLTEQSASGVSKTLLSCFAIFLASSVSDRAKSLCLFIYKAKEFSKLGRKR